MDPLWIATTAGLHVFGERHTTELAGHEVNGVTHDGSAAWALVDRTELWRRSDAGWESVTTSPDLRLNCVSVTNGNVLVGAANARLLRLSGDALEANDSFDRHPERPEWYTPWGGPPDVRSIAHSNGSTFVNVHVGGILRSLDAGATWTQTVDIHSDVHEVAATDGVVLAASAWGLGISRDGADWEFFDEGLHATYARAVALAGDAVVMSASMGPQGGRAHLYRRPLDGGAFEPSKNGLPDHFTDNIDTGCVAASDNRVAFATEDGRAFLSTDQGSSWGQIAEGLGAARWVLFA